MILSIDSDFGGQFDRGSFWAALEPLGAAGLVRRGDEVEVVLGAGDPDLVAAAVAAHTGAPLAAPRLASMARDWRGDASRIDWCRLAHVTRRPVASVFFALDATIERIDWIDPETVGPLDPYGERVSGDVIIREERTETDGALGPASRSYAFTSFRADGSVHQQWSTPVEQYPPAIQAQRGQARRDRAIQRVSGWLAAALGGTSELQAWMALKTEALAAFRDLAEPGPMIQAATLDTSPAMSIPISALGIHLVTDLDPADTLKDALLAVLARWS